jgi:hypothetical protein
MSIQRVIRDELAAATLLNGNEQQVGVRQSLHGFGSEGCVVDTTPELGLSPTDTIDEERFQHVLVQYLLQDEAPEGAALYRNTFRTLRERGISTEEAVQGALQKIVSAGLISKQHAERINGLTFRAAQLDDNLEALYDDRGSATDPTIATASGEEATKKAQTVLSAASRGEITVTPKALRGATPPHGVASRPVPTSGEFLWKPRSERDGKLVVLLPSSHTGTVLSAAIHSELPPSEEHLIEKGAFTGDTHNNGRAHFRFSKSGDRYPNGIYLVATLSNGKQLAFPIKNSGERTTR